MEFNILIIDDEQEMCLSLAELFESQGYRAFYAITKSEADQQLKKENIHLIIMDIRMPGINGLNLLQKVKISTRGVPVIMISGYASVDNIVEAMKYGALNFYKKPIDFKKLLEEIKQIEKAKRDTQNTSTLSSIITRNPRMLEIIHDIEKTASTDASVIITGESGTGKELVADSIHRLSTRSQKPFIKLNCAAIPETLLESLLFGHEKGSFTDAKETKQGKFEQAQGGSIFFDEIGDMSIQTQAKLLRVLQENEFERIGGKKLIPSDVRVIAATHRSVPTLIEENHFRSDLYYRLSVINIELPPLRERRDDIMLLAKHLLETFNHKYKKQIRDFSKDVKNIFMSHNWPGNIRELKNCIERAVIFCEGDNIEITDLPMQYQKSQSKNSSHNLGDMVELLSRDAILDALEKAGGKKQKAAEILNIHRKTLYNKIKKLGIE